MTSLPRLHLLPGAGLAELLPTARSTTYYQLVPAFGRLDIGARVLVLPLAGPHPADKYFYFQRASNHGQSSRSVIHRALSPGGWATSRQTPDLAAATTLLLLGKNRDEDIFCTSQF